MSSRNKRMARSIRAFKSVVWPTCARPSLGLIRHKFAPKYGNMGEANTAPPRTAGNYCLGAVIFAVPATFESVRRFRGYDPSAPPLLFRLRARCRRKKGLW